MNTSARPPQPGDKGGQVKEPRKRVRGPKPVLRTARFEDYDRLMRLEAHFDPKTLSLDAWRGLWLSSPLWSEVGSWWPIGWVLEIPTGELVGCTGNLPVGYHFRGERLLGAIGRAFLVLPENRGYGASSKLVNEFFSQRADFGMSTSANTDAITTYSHFVHKIPAGDWGAVAYFITGYRAFADRALQKLKVPLAQTLAPVAGAGLRMKDALLGKRFPKPHSAFTIEATEGFDSSFDVFWNELLRQKSEILLNTRDSATLSWHFSRDMRERRLWIFTASRNGQLRAYCIFARKDHETEPRRVRLVDYQTIEPEADLLPDLLAAALGRCVAEEICVLDVSGLGLPKTRAFEELTPYRRKQTWPFWYRAINPDRKSVV